MTIVITSDFQIGFRTDIGIEMTDRAAGYDPGGPYPGLPRAVGGDGKGAADDKKRRWRK